MSSLLYLHTDILLLCSTIFLFCALRRRDGASPPRCASANTGSQTGVELLIDAEPAGKNDGEIHLTLYGECYHTSAECPALSKSRKVTTRRRCSYCRDGITK